MHFYIIYDTEYMHLYSMYAHILLDTYFIYVHIYRDSFTHAILQEHFETLVVQ